MESNFQPPRFKKNIDINITIHPGLAPNFANEYEFLQHGYKLRPSEKEFPSHGNSFTKVKAHENAVKQYIDFGVILLQEPNNNRSLWPETNRTSLVESILSKETTKIVEVIFVCMCVCVCVCVCM